MIERKGVAKEEEEEEKFSPFSSSSNSGEKGKNSFIQTFLLGERCLNSTRKCGSR
jgi:hypothetical protein